MPSRHGDRHPAPACRPCVPPQSPALPQPASRNVAGPDHRGTESQSHAAPAMQNSYKNSYRGTQTNPPPVAMQCGPEGGLAYHRRATPAAPAAPRRAAAAVARVADRAAQRTTAPAVRPCPPGIAAPAASLAATARHVWSACPAGHAQQQQNGRAARAWSSSGTTPQALGERAASGSPETAHRHRPGSSGCDAASGGAGPDLHPSLCGSGGSIW